MSPQLAVPLLLAVGCGLLALPARRLVAVLPEPAEDPSAEPWDGWGAIASGPGLGVRCAAVAALVGAVVGWRIGADPAVLPWLVLVPTGVVLAVIDWHTRLLPKRIIWPAYAVMVLLVLAGALASGGTEDLVRAGVGSAAAFVLFAALWFVQPGGLGFGDVRLSAPLGLALGRLGWGELVLGLWAGFVLGAVVGLALRALGRLSRREHLAFGPFMLLGALVGVLWGGALWASIAG